MVRDTVQEWKDQHHQTGLQQGLEQGSTNEARTELEGWIDRPYEVDTLEDVFRPS